MSKTKTQPKEWEETTLDEVVALNPPTPVSKGVETTYVGMEGLAPFTKKVAQTERRTYKGGGAKFQNADTLVARITPSLENGKTAFIDILDDGEVGFGSTEFIVLRALEGLSEPQFVYYFATSPRFRDVAIGSMTGTSGRQRVQSDLLANTTFAFPALAEQSEIAGVLASLDDKIGLLREQNETLEAIAKAIFHEWFVAFNFPNENGEPYKASGGKMVESELGEIPEGWRVGSIDEVANFFDTKRVPLSSKERQKRTGAYPYYGATKVMDYIDDFIFDGVYLLLAEDGSVIDNSGYPVLQYVWDKFWVSNHAHVLQGRNGFSTELLYLLFRSSKVSNIVTGAVQLKINQANLRQYQVVIPSRDALKMLDDSVQPLFSKFRSNRSQVRALQKTRGALLPKLMSGEIRV